ncbi:MAG: RecX family transcriptional regulator [Bacteroidia bacterium]|nr:RecX family transcriptional regulator [Bacteroidia bacterium]MCZ2276419.1 RecX family transcriptional regulator [Bacteroidia bacterium]
MTIEEKARRFCAYQERSHQQVRDKLYSWGLHKKDVEKVIVLMIEEGYLNEERFAMAFAGGKFRIKHWGKRKIEVALRQHKVSEYCISKALNSIDEKEERLTAESLARKYFQRSKEKNQKRRRQYTVRYLLTKGYESGIAWQAVEHLSE